MAFYPSISKYYDYIFPYKPIQKKFIQSFLKPAPQRLLDVGCGSGELAIALSKDKHTISAVDFDDEMVRIAKNKVKDKSNPVFVQGDMRAIDEMYEHNSFNAISCFGNTVVHLPNENEIEVFINACHTILSKGGYLLLQILNYNNIKTNNIHTLPLIENDVIKFERTYTNLNQSLIDFNTQLTIKESGVVIENSIQLFAVEQQQVHSILQRIGFTEIEYYSSFNKAPLDAKSLPLIVKAKKYTL